MSRPYITAVTFEVVTDYAVEKSSLNIASLHEEQFQLINLGCKHKTCDPCDRIGCISLINLPDEVSTSVLATPGTTSISPLSWWYIHVPGALCHSTLGPAGCILFLLSLSCEVVSTSRVVRKLPCLVFALSEVRCFCATQEMKTGRKQTLMSTETIREFAVRTSRLSACECIHFTLVTYLRGMYFKSRPKPGCGVSCFLRL